MLFVPEIGGGNARTFSCFSTTCYGYMVFKRIAFGLQICLSQSLVLCNIIEMCTWAASAINTHKPNHVYGKV